MADVKAVRLRHVESGAVVSVSEDKVERMGSEWAPADEKKTPAKKAASSTTKKS